MWLKLMRRRPEGALDNPGKGVSPEIFLRIDNRSRRLKLQQLFGSSARLIVRI